MSLLAPRSCSGLLCYCAGLQRGCTTQQRLVLETNGHAQPKQLWEQSWADAVRRPRGPGSRDRTVGGCVRKGPSAGQGSRHPLQALCTPPCPPWSPRPPLSCSLFVL